MLVAIKGTRKTKNVFQRLGCMTKGWRGVILFPSRFAQKRFYFFHHTIIGHIDVMIVRFIFVDQHSARIAPARCKV